jgi:ubiquinone/menaquinone biosynthesis C-methylase UbiE
MTHDSRFVIKRWLHRQRFRDTVAALDLRPGQRLIDLGCGDAYFIEQLHQQQPSVSLVGYDPLANMAAQARERVGGTSIEIIESLNGVPDHSFDRLTCLETFEHLVDDDRRALLRDIVRLAKPEAKIIITVPVEFGLVGLMKNVVRLFRRKRYEHLTLKNALRSFVGLPVPRHINHALGYPYIFSHIGFDVREFRRFLSDILTVERCRYSPFGLGAVLPVTAILTCSPRKY